MFQTVDPKSLTENVFSLIGDQWMLITAGNQEKCNTMTASWGGLGVLWGKNVAMCVIRPQRYTFPFVEEQDTFTLSFFDEDRRKDLAFCGAKSGRDVDKIKECGFTVVASEEGTPYFEEARLVLVCRKLYWQDLDPSHFLDGGEIDAKHYPGKDYHRMFIGEIVEVLRRV
ncbi:flavin reductase family protein [Pseudoflavonifractor phocaeensis]|uniref:flavin reductase family protein n=1 Tax=Pseudoflavonifractor phocaeensis TaxID=1870988 RepID=UPI00195E17F5|nr:flavin reductase family protein [Pseudoflavonifractor phocaeensis]MBM6870988.1 flavin reductase family protein [Pseudoflavonifractor phocaeensis]MBM6937850.1 flavin reductase family protein [Pseudoflavonifractor phocaeensis]